MPDQSAVKTARVKANSETGVDLEGLLHAQKAELVSQLAGTIANQFNNIMMAVTSGLELEVKKAAPSQQRGLEQILVHSSRATSLVQKLLSFSRNQPASPRQLALNPVVEEISTLLQPLAGEDIEICVSLAPKVRAIMADPVEIEQIVLSLALLAREAMNRGGRLMVTTEVLQLDPKVFGPELKEPGAYALLSFQFTPAKATALEGSRDAQPLGSEELRLAQAIMAVQAIVGERGGHLRVSSRPTQGTTFRAYFPAVSIDTLFAPSESEVERAAPANRKTILIVDDDAGVRDPAAEFLKMEGFKVLQARTGPEALRIVQESRSRVDLLITDIVMAGMNGNEVAAELLKTHPELGVLYMSGDTDRVAKLTHASNGAKNAVLQKPFRLNKLNDKIHELLQ